MDTAANLKRHSGVASVLKAAATVLHHQQPVQVFFCKQQGDGDLLVATILTQWLHKACCLRQTGASFEQIATQIPQQLPQQKQPGPPPPFGTSLVSITDSSCSDKRPSSLSSAICVSARTQHPAKHDHPDVQSATTRYFQQEHTLL